MRLWVGLLLFLSMVIAQATPSSTVWFDKDPVGKVRLHVALFVASTCPHCHKAEVFFKKIETEHPWLLVHHYVINQDKAALEAFYQQLKAMASSNFSVPSVFFCGSHWTGFEEEATTGKLLTDALTYCYQQIAHQGMLSESTINVMQKWGGATRVHLSPGLSQSNFKTIVFSALTDAFLVCSLFCLAAFLAFIGMSPTKKWHQFSVGIVFLSTLVITHYVQQVHSAFYYQITFKLTWVAALIGLLLLFFIGKDYRTSRAKNERTPGFITYAAIVFTAFIVQTYQQTCPLNFALVFEQWITEQNLSLIRRFFYQLLYQIMYFLPMMMLFLTIFLLGRHRRYISFHKKVVFMSRLILASIGIILLIYPLLMANLWASIFVLIGSVLVGWLLERRYGEDI
jgi:glutaredoxin